MKKNERFKLYLSEISKRIKLTTQEFYNIAEENNIVNITARRDLKSLIEQGDVILEYGAIKLNNASEYEESRDEKITKNVEQKKLIAFKALQLLSDNEVIFVSPGTTTEQLISQIDKPVKNLITNGLYTFLVAKANPNIKNVTLIGGNYRQQSGAFVGGITLKTLYDFKFNKVFFTGTNIDNEGRIFNNDLEEAFILNLVLSHSTTKIGLFDKSKFGNKGIARVCSLKEISVLVTDAKQEEMAFTMPLNCELLIA